MKHQLPFKSILSFAPLVRLLELKKNMEDGLDSFMADYLLNELKEQPQFYEPIEDLSTLEAHSKLLKKLFSFIFSPFGMHQEVGAILPPFQMDFIFKTDKWKSVIGTNELNFSFKDNESENAFDNKLVYINHLILQEVYGKQNIITKNLHCAVPDPKTQLNRYFKANFNTDFIEIYPTVRPRELDKATIKLLTDNPFDQALWEEYLPYKNFEFRGFLVLKLIDDTIGEAFSSIKFDLLKKDAIVSRKSFANLEQKIRELYNIPSMRVGIVSFNVDEQTGEKDESAPKIWNSIIPEEEMVASMGETSLEAFKESFEQCIYHKMMDSGRPQVIEDLEEYPNKTAVEELMYAKGIRSFIVAPLLYNGVFLGGLELASNEPKTLTSASAVLLEKILPIFAMSAKRSLEEMENRLQAFIKEQYTAVHPSVEWRFSQAALKQLNHLEKKGKASDTESIVFDNVYPLFAQSDVRGSSTERNLSIQTDLIAQLSLARKTMRHILNRRPLNTVEELNYRIGNFMNDVRDGLSSGDETTVLMFLKREVEPLFKHFETTGLLSQEECLQYFGRLDPELGMLYERRKAFEESLTSINEAVSSYIAEQQVHAQQSFPHYFEKYKTDGVEYNMYIGSSITPGRSFDMIYLRELRLWQLKVTAQVAIMTHKMKDKLPIPLETTHLILVNGAPISIRFREDEKQFDVDGAYNIRYEIVKKRIDKAHIKDTNERLTQPNMIAIVYTQESDAGEYKQYIGYLQHLGLLEKTVEDLQLEDLQGVSGLRALRVKIAEPTDDADGLSDRELQELLQANNPPKIEK